MTAVMSTMQQCFWMLPAGPTEISPCSWPVMVRIFWFQLRCAHDVYYGGRVTTRDEPILPAKFLEK